MGAALNDFAKQDGTQVPLSYAAGAYIPTRLSWCSVGGIVVGIAAFHQALLKEQLQKALHNILLNSTSCTKWHLTVLAGLPFPT